MPPTGPDVALEATTAHPSWLLFLYEVQVVSEDQKDLFTAFEAPIMPPAQRHSDTSRAAALSMVGGTGSLRRRVLQRLADEGKPMSDEQLQAVLEMNPSTERPRRGELVKYGYIKDSGERGKTWSGRNATLWQVTAKGLAALAEKS